MGMIWFELLAKPPWLTFLNATLNIVASNVKTNNNNNNNNPPSKFTSKHQKSFSNINKM